MAGSKNAPVKPGRLLAFMAAILIAGVATMFGTDAKHPKLAIDLAGGTSVTLTAKSLAVEAGGKGGTVTPENMREAVKIIRQRVNGFGVSEAQVTTLGNDNIVVSVPGQNNNQIVDQVGQTALLRFRPVMLESTNPGPLTDATPSASPSASPSAKPDKADPKATKSPKADANRVVSSALRAADDPTPKPKASAKAKASASPEPTFPDADPLSGAEAPTGSDQADFASIPAAIQTKYVKWDCTKPENRQGGDTAAPTEYVVACDRIGSTKYLLGPSAVQGTEVSSAAASLPSGANVGSWQIDMNFDGTGTKQFGSITAKLAKQQAPQNHLAITLDGVVMSSPTVNESIPYGRAQINGTFTQQEAQDLANVLKYGALPLAFTKSKVDTVSATLGADQLNGGLTAGLLGLICVIAYCIFYYRGLGIVALLGLSIAGGMSYMSVSLLGDGIGYRLSLAGVAGLIVAIGITADSFVVYFERLRDEIRDGRSPRAAVEYGWVRARRTIVTANFVSLLASAVLYFFSVADVKGFAFTLGLATIIDVVVIFLFTKPMVSVLMKRRFFAGGHKLSGVNRASLGIHRPAAPAPGRPGTAKEA